MDERETVYRPERRREQTENPLLQKKSRNDRKKKDSKEHGNKQAMNGNRKNEYKLKALWIILIVLIILLIAAFVTLL